MKLIFISKKSHLFRGPFFIKKNLKEGGKGRGVIIISILIKYNMIKKILFLFNLFFIYRLSFFKFISFFN